MPTVCQVMLRLPRAGPRWAIRLSGRAAPWTGVPAVRGHRGGPAPRGDRFIEWGAGRGVPEAAAYPYIAVYKPLTRCYVRARFVCSSKDLGSRAPRRPPGHAQRDGDVTVKGTGKQEGATAASSGNLPSKVYEAELLRLQIELVTLQQWVRETGTRVLVIFEGRDAAGKGSAIKRITERLNPRWCRIAALPAPTERERSQWYFQRYVEHLPAAGEIVLFDRSWYNRAGVERVMGFCTSAEYRKFLHQVPIFERLLVEDGILLRKYWFSVSDLEQEKRFKSRQQDPMRRWKLSDMDLLSISKWVDYSKAKDQMFIHTDIPEAPWYVVESDDKKRSRLNVIAHLLSTVDYEHREPPVVRIPSRPPVGSYTRPPREEFSVVPDHAATLLR